MYYSLTLILRSLVPFLKEVLLRDKDFAQYVKHNFVPVVLIACLFAMFMMFYSMRSMLQEANEKIRELTDNAPKPKICTTTSEIKEAPDAPVKPKVEPQVALPPPKIKSYASNKLKAME